jgi:phosphoserine aminotransferase
VAALRIPTDLLPRDGRFGSGPSLIRPSQLTALADAAPGFLGTSHRQARGRDQVARLRRGVAELLGAPDGYEVVLGNGGTCAFWEIAAFGLVHSKAQVAAFGEFGQKFADALTAAPFLDDPTVRQAPAGRGARLTPEAGVDAYASPHNETSVGVAVPVERVARVDVDALMLHDATSAAGGLPVDLAQSDAYYFAPQKCLGSDGGLWLAVLSPKAIERAYWIKGTGRYIPAFLDLVTAIENSRLQQTYNTPSLATVFLAAEQIEWLLSNGGLDWAAKRSATSAETLYSWAERVSYATPFVADPADRSPVVATIDFDAAVDAKALAATLRANGILDTEPYRKLGRNQLRIAMYPSIDPADIAALTRCVEYVVERL